MAIQNDVRQSLPRGPLGTKVDASLDGIDSRALEGSYDSVFGKAVIRGSIPGRTVVLPNAMFSRDVFEGVAMSNFLMEIWTDGSIDIPEGSSIGVMRWGRVWVHTAPDAAPGYGDAAYVIPSGENAGMFTTEAAGNVKISGCFIGGKTDGDAAPLELFRQGI